ncbi:MAG: hypothetical protein H6Q00_1647 [Holophagaceae bacterium]|nr:hypothetical protein [Holophagaceae bacterium]
MSQKLKDLQDDFNRAFRVYREIYDNRVRLEEEVPLAQEKVDKARAAQEAARTAYKAAVVNGTGESEAKHQMHNTCEEFEVAQIRCEALEDALLKASDTRREAAAQNESMAARRRAYAMLAKDEIEKLGVNQDVLNRVFCYLLQAKAHGGLHWPNALADLFPQPTPEATKSIIQDADRMYGLSMARG